VPAWRSPAVWAVPAIALAAALAIVASGSNRALFLQINGWSRVTGPDLWPFVTVLGDTAVAIALFVPFAWRRRDVLWALVLAAVASTLFVHGIKPWVDAPRPPGVLDAGSFVVIGPAWRAHSFPSGHTTTAFTAAALVWMHFRTPGWRALALTLALAAGLSRAVVGVHWPLDIAAGAFGGWVSGWLGSVAAARWPVGTRPWPHAIFATLGIGIGLALIAGLKTGYPTTVSFTFAIGMVAVVGAIGGGLEARRFARMAKQSKRVPQAPAPPG
jgi:membrane-associated phospholipid phosphatase